MNAPVYIDSTLQKVKDALEVWAEWMQQDDTKLGYPSKSAVILSGGGAWGSFGEDLEAELDNTMANAVDAIVEGLPLSQKNAVFHFHIAAVFTPRRTVIEDDYSDALVAVEVGLRKRGLL
jgi:hypothetical protein